MKKLSFLLLIGLLMFTFQSCSDDDEERQEELSVEFATTTGEYKVKVGKEVTLEATVENATNPIYSWKMDGKIISTAPSFVFEGNDVGEYFLTFRVDADNGTIEKQAKVSVLDKLPPEISTVSSIVGYTERDTKIAPTISYTDATTKYEWRLDGNIVGTDSTYVLNKQEVDVYQLSLKVTNEDGSSYAVISVTILPEPTPEIFFDLGKYHVPGDQTVGKMSVPDGKSLVLAPVLNNVSKKVVFEWKVDGVAQSGATGVTFTFTPTSKKTYLITVTAKDETVSASTQVNVECVEPEGTYYRAATEASLDRATKAFEFVPAPGQFVNFQIGSTAAQATASIQTKLEGNSTSYIALLGAFGGYFVTGFDHSIENMEGQPDLYIVGNPLGGWSEPGIVWVMQDENGNGKPDDTWYELKGSETGKDDTEQRYAITYYKPQSIKMDVMWSDNLGNTGSVDYNGYHSQNYYYPMFMGDSYTLTGTRLKTTFANSSGMELNPGFDWGYVDNSNSRPAFDIEDAIQQDGTPANLKYIDFVKVHTAQLGKGKSVGEISTEASIPRDYHLMNK